MGTDRIKALADFLHGAEKKRTEVLRPSADQAPDLTLEEGYLIQEEIIRQKLAEGHKILGPKMGLTSDAKMKQMNVTDPIYGYTFDYMVENHGSTVMIDRFIHPKVEPEIGFILKQDLQGPGITRAQVLANTAFVFPAIEIIDSRYENFNFTLPDVVADNTSAAGLVMGTTIKTPENLELDALGAVLTINGEVKALGTGAAVLGHPANAVARLANMLALKGEKVPAGQPILTGGMTEAVRIERGDFVSVKIDGLGEVSFIMA
ncbi:2-keto-4-pentenoate hydratase [Jeotgalibaca sp. A127]|uniref:2-keto-4-pentenoate hydratase n=1 Tax=Jeotgalibaca sp. A127 TaxID=3457324 RepID=UPI003FD42277